MSSSQALGVVTTEGRINKLILSIHEDLSQHESKEKSISKKIESLQNRLKELAKRYKKARSYREKNIIRSEILSSAERLIEKKAELLNLTQETASSVLSKLMELRSIAKSQELKLDRVMDKRKFRKVNILYRNLARLAKESEDMALKGEIALLLRENEKFYRYDNKESKLYQKIAGGITHLIDLYSRIYTQALLASKRLQDKNFQLKIAKDLMKYTITLKALNDKLEDLTLKSISVPEVEDEIIDEMIFDVEDQIKEMKKGIPINQINQDEILERYSQEGPKF
jgi:hypothetical protein